MRNSTKRPFLRGALCLLLAVCLLGGLLPAAALAAETEPTESTFHYISNEFATPIPEDDPTHTGAYREDSFTWSDAWFFTDGRKTDYRLAALSAAASAASGGYSSSNAADFSERDRCLREFLTAMEFEDIQANDTFYCENLEDSLACVVAHKTISSGGKTATLLAIIPMSANYRDEWAGNFNVGLDSLHAGFLAGRDEALRFARQYAETYGIRGEIKVWTAGHSRGAAIANLLGAFFAGGGAAYLGSGVTVATKDVYCYTFATPATVLDSGATKAQLLSVAGSRAAYPQDTPGDAYAYGASDAAAVMKPDDDTFSCIHNCRLAYDFITMLPPPQWGFTVFGTEIPLDTGDAALKAGMETALQKGDPVVYEAYKKPAELVFAIPIQAISMDLPVHIPFGTDGGEDTCKWIKLDFPNLLIEPILGDDPGLRILAITADGEYDMAEMIASRIAGLCVPQYSQEAYHEDYQETFAAAMGIFGMAWPQFAGQFDASVAAPLALNYLAYASGRIGGENADADAVSEILLGLAEYLVGKELGAHDKITVDALVDALARALNEVLSNEDNELLRTVIPYALPDELSQAVRTVLGDNDATLLNLISKCVDDKTAKAGRQNVYQLAWLMLPEEQKELVYSIGYDTDAGVRVLNGSREVYAVVNDVLPVFLVDNEGHPVTLKQTADKTMVAMVTALQAKTLKAFRDAGYDNASTALLSAHFDTLKAHPAQVREILLNALCYVDESYQTTEELRTLITFLTQSTKVPFAHYNELYLAWMRAAAEGFVPEDGSDSTPSGDPGYTPSGPSGDTTAKTEESKKTEETQPIGFDDVSETDWSYDDIQYVAQRGLFIGTAEGVFSPKLGMTRGMFMAVLARLGGEDAYGEDWQEKGVAWCVAQGISDGSAPERPISRQEMVTMLWRMAGSPASDADISGRPDAADAAEWALPALRWAVEVGILKGTDTGALLPAEGATREQVAAVIHRYAELTGK